MKCKKCGADVPDWKFYCENCGEPTEEGLPPMKSQKPVSGKDNTSKSKASSNKTPIIIVSVVASVIIIALTIAVIWLVIDRNKNANRPIGVDEATLGPEVTPTPEASQQTAQEETSTDTTPDEQTESAESEPVQDAVETTAEMPEASAPAINIDEVLAGINLDDYAESSGLEFESNGNGTCTITGIGTCHDEVIVIPALNPSGEAVTKINEYVFNKSTARSFVIRNLDLTLQYDVFQYATLENLYITDSNVTFDTSCFSNCENLSLIYINNSNIEFDDYNFFKSGNNALLYINNCKGSLDSDCFEYSKLANIVIQSSELKLGTSVFSNSDKVTDLTIQDSIIEAKEYAFYKFGNNANVNIINSNIDFDSDVFEYSSVVNMAISGETLKFGSSVLANIEDLGTLSIDCTNIETGEYAFYKLKDLKTLSICTNNSNEGNTINIGDDNFEYCEHLEVLNIGKGNITIGGSTFSNCKDLATVTIDGVLLKINDYAFYNCSDQLIINYNGSTYTYDTIHNV